MWEFVREETDAAQRGPQSGSFTAVIPQEQK
jgi:hypothetical protein